MEQKLWIKMIVPCSRQNSTNFNIRHTNGSLDSFLINVKTCTLVPSTDFPIQ